MLTAVASNSKNLDGEISEQGGRAPYYLLVDDKRLVESIKNPFANGGGAGLSVAKMLEQKKVSKLIAGKIGENMLNALSARNIEYQQMSGLIVDSL